MPEETAAPKALISADGSSYTILLPNAGTDYIQGQIYRSGMPYEHEMLQAMAARLHPGDLVLDVGANIGNHTLYLAAIASATVIAFEPSPSLAESIRASAQANGLSARITTRVVAVSDTPGVAKLVNPDSQNLGGQRLEPLDSTIDGQTVRVVRVDDEMPDERVAAMKMDIEGCELQALRGARSLLNRDHPDVWVECLSWEQFRSVADLLAELGYRFETLYNPSPTHLFVHDPHPQPGPLKRSARLLLECYYREYTALVAARESLQAANAKYRAVTEQYASLKTRATEEQKRLAKQLQEMRDVLPMEDRLLVEQLEAANSQRKTAADRARHLEFEMAELTSRHSRLAADSREQIAHLLSTIDHLRAQLSASTASREAADTARFTAETAHSRRLAELRDEHGAALSAHSHRLTVLREKNEKLLRQRQNRIDSLEKSLQRVQNNADQERSRLRAELLTADRERERTVQLLRDASEGREISIDEANRLRNTLREQIDSAEILDRKLSERTDQLASTQAQVVDLESRCRAAHAESSALKNRLESAESTTKALTTKHARYRGDFNLLRNHIAQREDDAAGLKAELETARKEAAQLTTQLTDRDRRLLTLQEDVDRLEARRASVSTQLIKQTGRADQLASIAADESGRADWAEEMARTEHQRADSAEAAAESNRAKIAELTARITKASAQLKDERERARVARDREKALRASKAYRVAQSLRDARTWTGFWALLPRLISILMEKPEEAAR